MSESQHDPDHHRRMAHGRPVNAYCTTYLFPADDGESQRLFRTGNVLAPILDPFYQLFHRWIQPRLPNLETKCLDLGCGTGDWIVRFSQLYPQATFLGVDLIPVVVKQALPNVNYLIKDVNLGLAEFFDQYDFVQGRFICRGVQNYHNLINDCEKTLKPGGLFFLIDFDHMAYSAPGVLYPSPRRSEPDQPVLPAGVRFMNAVHTACTARGAHTGAVKHFRALLFHHGEFEQVEEYETYLPVVPMPGPNIELEKQVAAGVGPMWMSWLTSCRALLLSHGGFTTMSLSQLEDQARWEMVQMSYPLYVRVVSVAAKKKNRGGSSTLSSAASAASTSGSGSSPAI